MPRPLRELTEARRRKKRAEEQSQWLVIQCQRLVEAPDTSADQKLAALSEVARVVNALNEKGNSLVIAALRDEISALKKERKLWQRDFQKRLAVEVAARLNREIEITTAPLQSRIKELEQKLENVAVKPDAEAQAKAFLERMRGEK